VTLASTDRVYERRDVTGDRSELKPGVSIDEIAKKYGAKVTGRLDKLNTYRLQFEDAESADVARKALEQDSDVTSVESNFPVSRPPAPDMLELSSFDPMNLTPFRCSWINDQGWWLGVRFAVGAVLWLVLSSPETIFGQAPGAKSTGSRAPIKEVASILALPGGEAASLCTDMLLHGSYCAILAASPSSVPPGSMPPMMINTIP